MYRILSVLLFVSLLGAVSAQQIQIEGKVIQASTAEPLPGATVTIKGTTVGTSTDADGRYSLSTEADATLVFSSLGYTQQHIDVSGRERIDVVMALTMSQLNEVVVTALGLERESKDLGYAVQKLEPKEVAEVKSANFVDALAGRVAGVNVSQGATGVGSSSRIDIRGEASFSNNDPLFVIDGTPINNNSIVPFTSDAAAGFQEIDFGNGAMDINPDDLASVTVLKGPSAAALYGTRASNGVVVITTKDGSADDRLRVSFNSTSSIESAFRLPEFQNRYGQGNSGQFRFVDGSGGGLNDNISYSWGPFMSGQPISQFDTPITLPDGRIVRGGDVAVHGLDSLPTSPFIAHPDNLKDFYRTGSTLINSIALSQGGANGDFRLSYTDLRSESIIPGVDFDRRTISSRATLRPIDGLSLSSSLTYVRSASDNRPSGGYGSENVNYSLVAWGPRSLDISALEDYWQPGLEGLEQYSFNYTFFDNPYFTLLENRNSLERGRLFGNVSATVEISERLTFMLRSGLDDSREMREFRRAFSTNRFRQGAYAENEVRFQEINTDALLNYQSEIKDVTLDLSVGANRMDQRASSAQIQALSLAQPGIYDLSNASTPLEFVQVNGRKRINSVYGLAKLGYKDYLYVDITARNDWSSALATPISAEGVGLFYPSVSASFLLSRVVDMPKAISFAKLRASWAQVGNDTDPFLTASTFVAGTPFGGQPTYSAADIIPNADLRPELTSSVEFGADIRLFDDRLRIDATYFDASTQDQITNLPVPRSTGYSSQVVNGGDVRNRGVELIIGAAPIRGQKVEWTTTVNFSRNVATVEELPEGVDRLTLAYSRVYDNVNQTVWYQVEEGGRIGDMYGTGYARNENGDFLIDEEGRFIPDNTLKKLGNYTPDFIVGWANQLRFGRVDLGFLFDWRQGGILVSRTQALAGVGGQLAETADRDNDIVAEGIGPDGSPNTVAVSPESYYRQYYDRNHEENNVYDASYLKLRQFSVGYSFAMKASAGFFQEGRELRVSLIGRNLFALSEIPHFDPEQTAVQGQRFLGGVEDMSYATSRSLGLKVGYEF